MIQESFLDRPFYPGADIFRKEHPGVTAIFGRFLEPLRPMSAIDPSSETRLMQQVEDANEMGAIRQHIIDSFSPGNSRSAGRVNTASVHASCVAGTTIVYAALEGEPSIFFRSMIGALFGIYGGMVGSKLIEVPTRWVIDKFRMRQQKRNTKNFLDCELGPIN